MLRSLTSVQSQRQIESMPSKTKPRSRTKPPEERRNELMNAAQQLFLQRGVARTTIEQVTSTSHGAKGTFYLDFSPNDYLLSPLSPLHRPYPLPTVHTPLCPISPTD